MTVANHTLRPRLTCTAIALLLGLTGCASPSAPSYYQLPLPEVTQGKVAATGGAVFVAPVQVASYLNGRGLVLATSEVELAIARQHLWAEALDQQLQRQLRQRLQLLRPDLSVLMQSQSDAVNLTINVERFYGQADGTALFSGRYTLSSRSGSSAFQYKVPLQQDGYPALVAAFSQAVQQLSEHIASEL